LGKEGTGIAEGLHAEVGKNIMKKLNTAQKYIIEQLEDQVETGTMSITDLNSIKGAIERTVQDIDTDWRTADTEANQILQSVSSLVYASKKTFFTQPFGKRTENQQVETKKTQEEKGKVYDLEEERAKRQSTSPPEKPTQSQEQKQPKQETKPQPKTEAPTRKAA
ncbi:MAG: hypothetical protein WC254_07400, partial [Candidatus Woesearchaeota archaeon]